MKVWIRCATKYVDDIKDCFYDKKIIAGILDCAIDLQGTERFGLSIYAPSQENIQNDDIVIISSYGRYQEIYDEMIHKDCLLTDRILCFFDKSEVIEKYNNIIDLVRWKNIRERIFLEKKVENLEHIVGNMKYEVLGCQTKDNVQFPKIMDAEDALYRIIMERKSLCRFGDGEFEMIMNRKRPVFQQPDATLGMRLKEVLNSDEENVLIGIADNYGSLDKYTEEAAASIRHYMTAKHRSEQMSLLNFNRVYADTYITRPYIIYKDKRIAATLFNLWKKVWENRKVLIVEGQLNRTGYGNNLMDNVISKQRILAPNHNAWRYYKDILECIKSNADDDTLILLSLGPTATVMAYDLAMVGYQAIDIGQVDNEYEWYLRKAKVRENIPYKYTAEVSNGRQAENISDLAFESETIAKIGCE